MGYGYTGIQLRRLGAELADQLKKSRKPGNFLSKCWLQGFMSRWPEMRSSKPRGLAMARAMCSTPKNISEYFNELTEVLRQNKLLDKPHRIYNLDETGFSTEHKPPKIISGSTPRQSQAVISPRSSNVTVIGCGNAAGASLPPYFIFKGIRKNDDLDKDSLPGTAVAMSKTGWSNSETFKNFMELHFLKFVRSPTEEDPILLLYDGHRSHYNPELVSWAKENHIILFVLPPHTSHILQPLDVGVFGPLKTMFYHQCQQHMSRNPGEVITKYNICSLVCKVYYQAFSANNLISAFRKTGIYPLNRSMISSDQLSPHEAVAHLDEPTNTPHEEELQTSSVKSYLNSKLLKRRPSENIESTPKRKQTKSVQGNLMARYDLSAHSSKDKENVPPQNDVTAISGPSGIRGPVVQVNNRSTQSDSLSLSDDDSEDEKCVVCGRWTPAEVSGATSIIFVKWAQCDICSKWCHLRYCTNVTVVRRNVKFFCPICLEKE